MRKPMSVSQMHIPLLGQKDKRHKERKDLEPPLLVEAIAAFQINNSGRTHIVGQDIIKAPGNTFVGASPTFYKVHVATELALVHYPAAVA